jgi:hypothetical protein
MVIMQRGANNGYSQKPAGGRSRNARLAIASRRITPPP